MHLLGNKHFSLNKVTVRLTKIMNNLLKHHKFWYSKSFFSVENWPNFSKLLAQFLSALFIILVGLTMTLFREKMLISTISIRGFMSSSIKKSTLLWKPLLIATWKTRLVHHKWHHFRCKVSHPFKCIQSGQHSTPLILDLSPWINGTILFPKLFWPNVREKKVFLVI